MKSEVFDYDYYCNSSNERMASLDALRETNHPLFGDYEALLNRQKTYLDLMEYHRTASTSFGENTPDCYFNDKIMDSIASRIAKNDARMTSLYSRMTRKKVDRKVYYRKYRDEHRREIAARHRQYDRSKYNYSPKSEDYVKQYAFQHKDRTSLVMRISRFFSFDKGDSNDYFASLKRAVQEMANKI